MGDTPGQPCTFTVRSCTVLTLTGTHTYENGMVTLSYTAGHHAA